MNLNQLSRESFQIATYKGFWDTQKDEEKNTTRIVQKIALVHCELSEAVEELRKNSDPRHLYFREEDGKPEGFGIELADAVIRIADLFDACDLDMNYYVQVKLDFNKTRPRKHGRNF